jgi:D-lactate dehydrogenase
MFLSRWPRLKVRYAQIAVAAKGVSNKRYRPPTLIIGSFPIHQLCRPVTGMKVLFFSAHSYDTDSFNSVSKPDNFEFEYHYAPLSSQNASIAAGHDAICIFVNDNCDAEVLEILHENGVKAVLLRCAGFNNVNCDKAKELGIFVARVPGTFSVLSTTYQAYSPEAVAEHATALIMTLNRKTHRAYNRVRENNFSLVGLLGFTLHGKTAGIVGTGRIGLCTAKILKGFGCEVLGFDIHQNPQFSEIGGHYVQNLNELLSQSDIVSLHAPLLESTKHLINADSLSKMKKGAMLVNTSRGGLISHSAIIDALKKKHLGALAIDVYEAEEGLFFQNHEGEILDDEVISRLMTFPNVLITGHQGFFTKESLMEIAHTTIENLTCFEQGVHCPNTC